MEPIKPIPPDPIPSSGPKMRLRKNYLYPHVYMKTILRKLRESTTWVGLAVVAQFVPLGMEELQAIWTVVTGIAGVVLMFIDEPKTTREKDTTG